MGRHVIANLIQRGHQVCAVARAPEKAMSLGWPKQVRFIAQDIHDTGLDVAALVSGFDAMMHLAWPGLPNYRELFHFEETLPRDCMFLKSAIQAGLGQLLVTGTCLEYGLTSGAIGEDSPAAPICAYPLAKNALHEFLLLVAEQYPFVLQWVRLFYMHGPGQSSRSLLSQLDRAIDTGAESFNMSGGEQLRDYLPVAEAAGILAKLVERPDIKGPINCCSGLPISVRRLVETRVIERQANIRLNLGVYPYLDYEPMAFWGTSQKLTFLRETS